MSSWEHKAHVGLAVVLCGLSAWALTRPPAVDPAGDSLVARGPAAPSPRELQLAIDELEAWVREATSRTTEPQMARLRLAALGRRGLPTKANAPGDEADAVDSLSSDGRDAEALRLLLESRTAPQGEDFATAVREALGLASADDSPARRSLDPARLDLLALATLADINRDRGVLADAAHYATDHLEREYRPLLAWRGRGRPTPARLHELARQWDAARGIHARGGESLRLSAAIFRATAVLDEPDLDARARRHLSSVLFRGEMDRLLYEHLLATRRDPEAELEIRRDAIENLGQLVQALYNAHLALKTRATPRPSEALSRAVARAADDLVGHLSAMSLPRRPPTDATPELTRAAVHALRGLRLSRRGAPLASATLAERDGARGAEPDAHR